MQYVMLLFTGRVHNSQYLQDTSLNSSSISSFPGCMENNINITYIPILLIIISHYHSYYLCNIKLKFDLQSQLKKINHSENTSH